MTSRRVLLIQHFFHPDDVVNARLYTDLAVGLRRRGWTVTVLTSDRVWSQPERRLARDEEYAQVQIHRVHRPAWTQSDPKQRLANAAWLGGAWALRAASMAPPDVVVLGSDPAFAATLAIPLRRL